MTIYTSSNSLANLIIFALVSLIRDYQWEERIRPIIQFVEYNDYQSAFEELKQLLDNSSSIMNPNLVKLLEAIKDQLGTLFDE